MCYFYAISMTMSNLTTPKRDKLTMLEKLLKSVELIISNKVKKPFIQKRVNNAKICRQLGDYPEHSQWHCWTLLYISEKGLKKLETIQLHLKLLLRHSAFCCRMQVYSYSSLLYCILYVQKSDTWVLIEIPNGYLDSFCIVSIEAHPLLHFTSVSLVNKHNFRWN